MQHTTTLLDCVEFLPDLQKLCAESRSICAASRALCAQARQIKSPWPHPLESATPLPEEQAPHHDNGLLEQPTLSPYDQAMELLHTMRAMLDTLPLEWQVAVVKAITAGTLLKAHERTRPAPPVLGA